MMTEICHHVFEINQNFIFIKKLYQTELAFLYHNKFFFVVFVVVVVVVCGGDGGVGLLFWNGGGWEEDGSGGSAMYILKELSFLFQHKYITRIIAEDI